ncbi:MAG TPA: hypothetical protein VMP67_09495 [Candidatus Limnocylindria bacterium]|nr:hypothetical protein [Candidatus Limnocylindria bacterium]
MERQAHEASLARAVASRGARPSVQARAALLGALLALAGFLLI